ncbi:hypothetical protein ABZ595_10580 [Streptomyces rubradiris]|uniref:hypothetical protein n=1 Tax=Streptomyces rubradiris TaxID=285531 RepID=UPI0033F2ADC7
MDSTPFSEEDLARLALSARLRDLSEALRKAVAAPDAPVSEGPGSLAAEIRRLGDEAVPAVQNALVAYLRARGTSWQEIAEQAGVSEEDARGRWAGVSPQRLPDPRAVASDLDAWYVRHAQLEPLAQVPDPVSRLLGRHTAKDRHCLICAKYAGEPVPAWAGRPVPPGGHLIDDGIWRVGHGPTSVWPRGTLLIESHRHFLDYAEFTPEEAASLGGLVRRLTNPLKEATGAPRIHVFSSMEGTAHFHLWLVPRTGEVQSGRTYISDPGYCTDTEAEEVVHALRGILESAEEGE